MNTTEAQIVPYGTLIETQKGNRIHTFLMGKGKFTFVFAAGFGSPSTYTDFKTLADSLVSENQVVLIDRAGVGFSDAAPLNFKLQETAIQLNEILQKIEAKPPYILVAHSFGALEALHFASKFNEKVAGIVLIDGVSPQTYQNFSTEKPLKFLKFINKNRSLFKIAINLGLVGEWNKRKKLLSEELIKADKYLLKKNFANQTMIETAGKVKDFAEIVKNEINIQNIPLLVISAKQSFTELGFNFTNWQEDQKYLTNLSKKSTQVIIDGSHATIHLSQKKEIIELIVGFIKENVSKY